MSALNASALWNRCLFASLAVNGVAVGALGVSHLAHPDADHPKKVAAVAKKKPTRLMEIRMADETMAEDGAEETAKGSTDGDASEDGASEASETSPAPKPGKDAKLASQPKKPDQASKLAFNVDFGKIALTVPKPRTVYGPSGVIDLRNVHIKGTTSADPNLLAKNQPPNKLIGKSQIKVVGEATSLAKCIAAVGGNTIYGGTATILLGKSIDIEGTKFCAPGSGFGVPGSGQSRNEPSQSGPSQNGSSQSLSSSLGKDGDAGSKAKTPMGQGGKSGKGLNARDGAALGVPVASGGTATGPVRNVDEAWVSYGYRGGGKRMGGPATDLHLPASSADPTDRVRPATSRAEAKPVKFSRFEPAPVSVGSHSERGTIPWGPDSKKKRPLGLKGDYFLGNEFERYQFTRVDRNIDFNWTNRVVDSRLTRFQPFSIRWTGYLKPDFSETYTIYTSSDDGVRLWIDGKLVIDNWTEHAPQENVARVNLVAGREVPIRLEYFEIDGLQIQVMKLYWESPSQPKVYIPARSLFQPGR